MTRIASLCLARLCSALLSPACLKPNCRIDGSHWRHVPERSRAPQPDDRTRRRVAKPRAPAHVLPVGGSTRPRVGRRIRSHPNGGCRLPAGRLPCSVPATRHARWPRGAQAYVGPRRARDRSHPAGRSRPGPQGRCYRAPRRPNFILRWNRSRPIATAVCDRVQRTHLESGPGGATVFHLMAAPRGLVDAATKPGRVGSAEPSLCRHPDSNPAPSGVGSVCPHPGGLRIPGRADCKSASSPPHSSSHGRSCRST